MIIEWAPKLLTLVYSFWAFILLLMPLVVFHELGHFLFAKWFNVRVDTFSVGFGPKIWSKVWGETEYRLAWIPMGGYVKLFGEDAVAQDAANALSAEDKKRALHEQAPWKRFLIYFGGPLFNFILAVALFMGIVMTGEPELSNKIARVVPYSAAWQQGLRSEDRIVQINTTPVERFRTIDTMISEHPREVASFTVQRYDFLQHALKTLTFPVTLGEAADVTIYGEPKVSGTLPGISPYGRQAVIYIADPASFAAQAGFVSGDQILEITLESPKKVLAVPSFEVFEAIYGAYPTFYVHLKNAQGVQRTILWQKPDAFRNSIFASDVGFFTSEMFIDVVVSQSPADKAGVLKGDRIVSLQGESIYSFTDLKDMLQKFAPQKATLDFTVQRQGNMITLAIEPKETSQLNYRLEKTKQYIIGIMPKFEMVEPETVIYAIQNPIEAFQVASARLVDLCMKNLISFKKMLVRETSTDSLGGPLLIGKLAGESLSRGMISFLSNMAIFSIGLGVLNLLPIPVLDGGHIVLLGVELIRRKRLTLKQVEWVHSVGLVFVLGLMLISFKNDILRFFF